MRGQHLHASEVQRPQLNLADGQLVDELLEEGRVDHRLSVLGSSPHHSNL